jgi:peptidoglycan/LPS O-acetylase OafA/YrhL
MINTTTSIIVTLFFLHGALACFVAGLHFWSVKDHTIKFFGLGFIFSGLAFSTWAFLAANRLDSLRIIATLAAVFLILGLFSFLLAGIQSLEGSEAYGSALLVGALGALGLCGGCQIQKNLHKLTYQRLLHGTGDWRHCISYLGRYRPYSSGWYRDVGGFFATLDDHTVWQPEILG